MTGQSRIPHDAIERPAISLPLAQRVIAELIEARPDACLTLAGAGDPLLHPEVFKIIDLAKRAGVSSIHLRTDLLAEAPVLDRLLESGVDILSVDLMAESAATYRTLMGADAFARARSNLERLIEARNHRHATSGVRSLPTPHIVPRLTRCDVVHDELEAFYDRWLLSAGAAAIDPLPPQAVTPRDRIEPIPPPLIAARRFAMERLVVLCDGRVPYTEHDWLGERIAGDLSRDSLVAIWKRVVRRRLDTLDAPANAMPSDTAAISPEPKSTRQPAIAAR